MNAHPVWWDAIWNLTHVVQRGQPFLPPPHTSAYDVLRQDPDAQNLFDLFMSRRSAPVAYALGEWAATAAVPDGATFVDVGGGRGTLLAALLTALPTCRGVLLDRPVVIAQARTYLADHNVADRCEMSGGDFFAAIPQGGHTYVLGSVLHNLGDAAALHLLQLIRAAMTDGSAQLLCVDVLLPDGPQPHVGLGLLLRMMSLFPGGHERTITEYVALLHKAGFAVAATSSLPHGLSLVVARPTLS
ncbi:methyltransferase [Streptosporangium lutulentum]